MTPAHPSRASSSLWLAAWVLAPLLLLTALGLRGLQVSRQTAYEDATAQVTRALETARQELLRLLPALRARTFEIRLYPPIPLPQPTSSSKDFTPSGLPLLPLLQWELLISEKDPAALPARTQALIQAGVETHPSILTPIVLSRTRELLQQRHLPETTLDEATARWEKLEALRIVLRSHPPASPGEWLHAGPETWWTETSSSTGWKMYPRSEMDALAASVLATAQRALPAYATATLAIGGATFPPTPPTGETLGQVSHEAFLLRAVLTSPAQLYGAQRRQMLWLGALLACAFAAELAAFWVLRRALTRETRLGVLKSAFVSSVSHELRAPVASMRLMAENLETGVVHEPEHRRAYHRLMAEECRRLSALIDNVLDFARIEQNRRLYQMVETDLAALTREAVDLLQPRAAQHRQQLTSDVPPLERLCDGLAVRQALINLLDNAIKFSPEGAAIRVTLRACPRAAWELVVDDQGHGIPAEEHERIFERFYRLGDELRRETQGTGIGLSIVQHIVHAHGGRVEVESAVGQGARFTLHFPDAPPAGQDLA